MSLLEVTDVSVHFRAGRGATVRAVDGVRFAIEPGEVVGLVGESGCGKTTLGRALIGLVPRSGGEIRFDGRPIGSLRGRARRRMCRRAQMIFQDPYGSLNPRLSVGRTLGEPLGIHRLVPRRQRSDRVGELLLSVGLDAGAASRYPHEFSGGQRQRIGIARALAVEPDFVVADEPVSALDVSVQAQIVNLLGELRERRGLTYLFISHDLAVVEHISDRVLVMYVGRIVEELPADRLTVAAAHPYTKALLSAVPVPDPTTGRDRIVLRGDVPSVLRPPSGCPFHPRCPEAVDRCSVERPLLRDVAPGHRAACHLVIGAGTDPDDAGGASGNDGSA
jgi:oligopeptide/dipeptide ABC transporter ATP-binding protein